MSIDNFRKKREMNPSLFYDYKAGNEGKIKYVFWVGGIYRKNYYLFGDVIFIWHNLRYKQIFHDFCFIYRRKSSLSSITFGAVLLTDEKYKSFVWLFEAFLKAIGGHKSVVIITDQEQTVKNVVEEVFNGSSHRFCMRHILKNIKKGALFFKFEYKF